MWHAATTALMNQKLILTSLDPGFWLLHFGNEGEKTYIFCCWLQPVLKALVASGQVGAVGFPPCCS